MGKARPAAKASSEVHEAARSGDLVKIVSLLSSNPLSVNSRDKHSRTPLYRIDMNALQFSIAERASALVLHLAAWSGQLEIVNYLCKNKADVGACAMDDMGAIHFASQKGHLDIVKALVSFGVSIKSYTRKGMTPLHFAAQGSHMDLVKYLVRKGANLNAVTKADKTPLDISTSQDIRSYLEESEKNPVKQDANEEDNKKEIPEADKVEQADTETTGITRANDDTVDEDSKRKSNEPLKESSSVTKKARVALNHLSTADDDNPEDE